MPWNPERLPDLGGRTYAVTGATGGIGYFAAEQLAAAGADVVLVSRSAGKLETAARTIRAHAPRAVTRAVTLDLTSLASVADAAERLGELPLDGIFLNGGPMEFSTRARTRDGLPLLLGAHTVANVALIARMLPVLADRPVRFVHASTGFVRRFKPDVRDVRRVPRSGVGAYTKAKALTEVYAFELERRLRARELPAASIVTRPGVGVDAKTPEREGIRDAATPYRANPFTPWAQGKDAAAWSGVRALADPEARGGEYYGPEGGLRGRPVAVPLNPRTAEPAPELAEHVWQELHALAGVEPPL